MLTEPIAVTMTVVDALDTLGVPYAIGGSLVSALHGVMRATMDADLVADLRLEHVGPLAQTLGVAFYADVEMIRDAIRRHSSFNLVHLETMFIAGDSQFHRHTPVRPRGCGVCRTWMQSSRNKR